MSEERELGSRGNWELRDRKVTIGPGKVYYWAEGIEKHFFAGNSSFWLLNWVNNVIGVRTK